MKLFDKKNLVKEGEYVYYVDESEKKVVARFKHNKSLANKFMNFLRTNVSVERYFGEYSKGSTPIEIVRSRGFV